MKALIIWVALIIVAFFNLSAVGQEGRWPKVKITKSQQINSDLIPWVEKINGLDRKYFAGKTLFIPKDIETVKNYSPLPTFDSSLAKHDSVVVVFLGHSLIGVYEHGRLVFWSPITRGKKITYTQTGECFVRSKVRLMYSKKYGNVPMPYSLHLFGNVCIHQGPMVGRGASHGCIRLFKRDAQWLYAWARKGTKVIIKI
jgi:hypothetical protein